ncbi:MAG: hypothetical protein RL417_762 [Pseudomonadota bacterium]|jgi:hypothetical protein
MRTEEFKLVLEGIAEDSPEALRRVKGALLGEIGLSVSEAQTVLQALPFTLFTSSNEAELDALHGVLSAAGATVTIVRPKGAEESDELDFQLDVPKDSPQREPSTQSEPLGATLDFFVETAPPPINPAVSTPERFEEAARGEELVLELLPAEDLPPLKESLVEPEPIDFGEPPISAAAEVTTPLAQQPAAPPPPMAEKASVGPRAAPPTGAAVAAPPRFTEHPNNVPIGRQMRERMRDGTPSPMELLAPPTDLASLITPEFIMGLCGAIGALAVINWWIFG